MASLRSILNTPIGGRKSRDSAGNRMGPEKPEGEKNDGFRSAVPVVIRRKQPLIFCTGNRMRTGNSH